jgi:hypothetical protein
MGQTDKQQNKKKNFLYNREPLENTGEILAKFACNLLAALCQFLFQNIQKLKKVLG